VLTSRGSTLPAILKPRSMTPVGREIDRSSEYRPTPAGKGINFKSSQHTLYLLTVNASHFHLPRHWTIYHKSGQLLITCR